MLLEFDQLAEKENLDIQKVLSVSIEYLLAGIAVEHSNLLKLHTVNDFNSGNRLTQQVLLSYPFFVALANGNSKSLYNLLGEFYVTKTYGPFSVSAYALFQDQQNFPRQFKHFNIPAITEPGTLQINENEISLKEIKAELKKEMLDLNGEMISFNEIKIKSDKNLADPDASETFLCNAIDSSIKIIHDQSGGSFFDGDYRTIKHQSAYFDILRKEFSDNEEVRHIPYGDIGKPDLRPFYSEKDAYLV